MSNEQSTDKNQKERKALRKPQGAESESTLAPTHGVAQVNLGGTRHFDSNTVQREEMSEEEGMGSLAYNALNSFTTAAFSRDYSRIPARTFSTSTGARIQPNLMVNAPGDQYEQEADRVAEAVMAMPDPPLPMSLSKALGLGEGVSRMPTISRIQASGGGFQASPEVESRINRMEQGGGQALPASERDFFEQRMGHDFSDVRIHTDSNAEQTSQDISAAAFTLGKNIAFNQGMYQPGTPAGRQLLAHELTHVVQQGGAKAHSPQTLARMQLATNPSRAMIHLQRLGEQAGKIDRKLYRKEIATFTDEYGVEANMAAGHSLMMEGEQAELAINEKDNSRSLRRCSGGGGGGGSGGGSTKTPAALKFESASFSNGGGGKATTTVDASRFRVDSGAYSPKGEVKVSGGTDAEAADWEAGFIQTAHSAEVKIHYVGSPTEKLLTYTLPGAANDRLDSSTAPWYDSTNANGGTNRAAFTKTASTLAVDLWDQPGMGASWVTPDTKGKHKKTEMKASFTAWMIARKKSAPNTIQYLNWNTWEVDMSAESNYYKKKGTKTAASVTGESKSTGSGTDQGSTTPVLSGDSANKKIGGSGTWS